MQKGVPTSVQLDIEQRAVEVILTQKEKFTQKQIEEELCDIFNYIDKKEVENITRKVLSELLQTGEIIVHSHICNPSKEIKYALKK